MLGTCFSAGGMSVITSRIFSHIGPTVWKCLVWLHAWHSIVVGSICTHICPLFQHCYNDTYQENTNKFLNATDSLKHTFENQVHVLWLIIMLAIEVNGMHQFDKLQPVENPQKSWQIPTWTTTQNTKICIVFCKECQQPHELLLDLNSCRIKSFVKFPKA